MKVRVPHRWDVSTTEAKAIQEQLRSQVSQKKFRGKVRHVAGVDVSVKNNRSIAAVVVLRFADLEIVDVARAELPVKFPYVPGYLSFREIPVILAAMERLVASPDLFLIDGQGIAHPRRVGLASHLGVLLDKPTIGCAKSRFIGTHEEPDAKAGCYTDLFDRDELIGAVLRMRTNVKPLYISVGHKIDLPTALDIVLDCCAGYRLPEPTRLAHQAAGGTLRM